MERRRELEMEKARQLEWLQQRSQEITGTDVQTSVQISLFETANSNPPDVPQATWMQITEPRERLAGFATDTNQPVRLRSEADGVLRIYQQRIAVLQSKLALQTPEVLPLGVLMLVP